MGGVWTLQEDLLLGVFFTLPSPCPGFVNLKTERSWALDPNARNKWMNEVWWENTGSRLGEIVMLSKCGSSVQSLSCIQLFATPWTAAHQASQSITNSRSLLKLMSIESVMPSNHLILCCPLLLPPSIFSSIRVFSNESVLCIRWPKYWSFSFSISSPNEYSGLISFRKSWFRKWTKWKFPLRNGLVGSPCSPRDSQESSPPTP